MMSNIGQSNSAAAEVYKIREIVALFDDGKTLEEAIDTLDNNGFNRSDISLLATEKSVEEHLGHRFRRVEEIEDDDRIPRKAFVSEHDIAEGEAALVGGLLYIGAVAGSAIVVASGGALAFALLAAAVGGTAGASLGGLAAMALGDAHAEHLDKQLQKGGLVLWVRLRDQSREAIAENILSKAGGRDIHTHEIERTWGIDDIPLHDFNPDPFLED